MDSKFAFATAVVFIHIPKTAGMSFTRYLESGLKGSVSRGPSTISLDKELFCGHEYLRAVYPRIRNGYFITFLRNPVARTISQYNYVRSPGLYPPGWRGLFPKEEVEVLEFCRAATFSEFINCADEKVAGHIVNPQTKMLCDHEVERCDLMGQDLPEGPELASACNNLITKIDFLGICEMFASSLVMFRRETGVDGAVVHINESPRREVDLSAADHARLREILNMDLRLYEFALKIFHRRMNDWLERVSVAPDRKLGAQARSTTAQRCS